MAKTEKVAFAVDEKQRVSGLLLAPRGARAFCVLAHGAGAGMTHPFMTAIAEALAARRIGTLRYQFPYMERGSRRPDSPKLAQATVRAAVGEAARRAPRLPLIAGGKSFGGRMTSEAQAEAPLTGVSALAFLGFPLHPPGKPASERGEHLTEVKVPMLFVQGGRDSFAEPQLLQPLIARLGARATLHGIAEGDHSFRVPARSGRAADEVMDEIAAAFTSWIDRIVAK